MFNLDFFLIYIGLPISVLVPIALFWLRLKGKFTSFKGRLIYVIVGLLSATVSGLVLQVYSDNLFLMSVSVILIVFVIFIYNAPRRGSRGLK